MKLVESISSLSSDDLISSATIQELYMRYMYLLMLFTLSICPVSAEVTTSHHQHADQGQRSFEAMVVKFEDFLQIRLDREQPLMKSSLLI